MKFTPPTRIILIACLALLSLPAAASAQVVYGSGSYATDLPSSAPAGLAPASGTTIAYPDDALAFSWNRVSGAAKYQVQVARQASSLSSCSSALAFATNSIVVDTTVTESAWIPTLLDAKNGSKLWTGDYCWRVRSTGARPGVWSAPAKFSRTWQGLPTGLKFYNDVDGPIPRTTGSADYTTGSASTETGGYLSWSSVEGAATYEVQVGTAPSFSDTSIKLSRDGIRDSRVSILHLPDNTYYWRVRAIAPNGTEGGWSTEHPSFTVAWKSENLSQPANVYPADSSTVSDMRVGWTPVAGASYYQYQIAALPSGGGGCTWDPDAPDSAPAAYGNWVNYPAIHDELENLVNTAPRLSSQCRLSPIDATTMNNWVTLQDAWDPEVFSNIGQSCEDDAGKVQCAPAFVPDDTVDPLAGTKFQGTAMSASETNGPAYKISWRVRPVYELSQNRETGWKVSGTSKVYGSWNSYSDTGSNRGFQFNLHEGGLDTDMTSSQRCTSSFGNGCVVNVGSQMQAGTPLASGDVGDSTSLQMPVLTWKPFAGAGGYVVQVAHDPQFNNIARTQIVPATASMGYGFTQSWTPTDSFSDDFEGTGYWWRVIPCNSQRPSQGSPITNCISLYGANGAGLPVSEGGANTHNDMGVAQTFKKHSALQTKVTPNFEGSAPLISWTSASVASQVDYPAWARGMNGAAYYEVMIDNNPFMNNSPVTLKTTMPRIVPFREGDTEGSTLELDDGVWYYKVRAVDRNGLAGSWTTAEYFNKRVAPPGSVVSGGGGPAAGTGAVRVSWQDVPGATLYEVQWSTTSDFSSGNKSANTSQTTFLIPSSTSGSFHWRVRAKINGTVGDWTNADVTGGGPVNITQGTQIQTAVSRFATPVGRTMQVYGKLLVNGVPVNGKLVSLQMKNTTCNAAGAYAFVKSTHTGVAGEEGTVGYNIKPDRNRCFRWAYNDGVTTVYSAPMSVTARPITSVKYNKTRMLRKQAFYYTVRSNQAVSGRVRFQYQVGRRWVTAHTVNVRFMKARKQRVFINRAGTFNTRVVIDLMYMGRARFTSYVNVYQRGPRVRVNDLWRVYR